MVASRALDACTSDTEGFSLLLHPSRVVVSLALVLQKLLQWWWLTATHWAWPYRLSKNKSMKSSKLTQNIMVEQLWHSLSKSTSQSIDPRKEWTANWVLKIKWPKGNLVIREEGPGCEFVTDGGWEGGKYEGYLVNYMTRNWTINKGDNCMPLNIKWVISIQ